MQIASSLLIKKVFPSQIRLLVLDAEYFSENDKTCDISVYMLRDDGQGTCFVCFRLFSQLDLCILIQAFKSKMNETTIWR